MHAGLIFGACGCCLEPDACVIENVGTPDSAANLVAVGSRFNGNPLKCWFIPCRWDDAQASPVVQQYCQYGLGTAYVAIALVALVRRRRCGRSCLQCNALLPAALARLQYTDCLSFDYLADRRGLFALLTTCVCAHHRRSSLFASSCACPSMAGPPRCDRASLGAAVNSASAHFGLLHPLHEFTMLLLLLCTLHSVVGVPVTGSGKQMASSIDWGVFIVLAESVSPVERPGGRLARRQLPAEAAVGGRAHVGAAPDAI